MNDLRPFYFVIGRNRYLGTRAEQAILCEQHRTRFGAFWRAWYLQGARETLYPIPKVPK